MLDLSLNFDFLMNKSNKLSNKKELNVTDRNIDKILDNYYSFRNDEEGRFNSRANRIEFITTTKYIDKYLKSGDRILEIGAGTGNYSVYYAKKGYQVDAIELIQSNLDILESKISDDMNIKAIKGNALDLSMYKDDTFDICLVLGPLYHLFSDEETSKAISEAIRVTKKRGKIYLAFLLFDFTLIKWGFQNKNLYENFGDDKMVSTNFTPNNSEELIFNMRYLDEIKKIIDNFSVKQLHYVASDGIGNIINDDLENMSDEEYKIFIDYHLSICERSDLIGYSGHILLICEK